jgi:hypothetical protein
MSKKRFQLGNKNFRFFFVLVSGSSIGEKPEFPRFMDSISRGAFYVAFFTPAFVFAMIMISLTVSKQILCSRQPILNEQPPSLFLTFLLRFLKTCFVDAE